MIKSNMVWLLISVKYYFIVWDVCWVELLLKYSKTPRYIKSTYKIWKGKSVKKTIYIKKSELVVYLKYFLSAFNQGINLD